MAIDYVCGEVFDGGVGEDGGGVDEYGYFCEVGRGGAGLVDGEEGEVGDVDGAFGGAGEVGRIGVEGVVDGNLVYESCGGELLEG